MKNQKAMPAGRQGFIQIILVLAIVAVLGVVGYLLYVQNQSPEVSAVPSAYQAQYTEAGNAVTSVENSSDLSNAAASLDAEDMAQIDAELKLLDSSLAGF